jgi:hypothetical protein
MMLTRSEETTKAPPNETSFVVPGVPESSQVFTLTPASFKTVTTHRVAGGIRFSLKADEKTYVLITENPHVIQAIRQRIARDGPRYLRLVRESIAMQTMVLAENTRRLTPLGFDVADASAATASAGLNLRQIDALLYSGSIGQAEQLADNARDALRPAAERMRTAAQQSAILTSNPLALDFSRLADVVALQRSLPAAARGENLLYGGDFEDVGQMTQLGWKHFRNEFDGVESRAELSTAEPRHGNSCLQLQNFAPESTDETQHSETAVWIQSPPIPVDAGWLEITGWLRVDGPIDASCDGLQIADSLGGADLALAVRSTSGWQRFQMIRATGEPAEVRLTFALRGAGAARIDAVMLRPLKPTTQSPPPLTGAPQLNVRPVASGPLLLAPQGP